jgi:cysteine-rich repeat protein
MAGAVGPARAHSVTVDGDPSDWFGAPLAVSNVGRLVSNGTYAGEFVWTDRALDTLSTDPFENPDLRCDLLDFAVTADAKYLYVRARLNDVPPEGLSGDGAPMLQVALDLDNVDGSGEEWMRSSADTLVSGARWEYLLQTRFGSAVASGNTVSAKPYVFDVKAVDKVAPGDLAVMSADTDTIEMRVAWSTLGLAAGPTKPVRFTVAMFRSKADDVTKDIGGPNVSNAIDVITNYGDPGSAKNTLDEVTDQFVNYFFEAWFHLLPGNEPSAPVVISELVYNAPATATEPDAEWVEIFNRSRTAVDVKDFAIGDEETPDVTTAKEAMFRLPAGATMGDAAVLVVGNKSAAFAGLYPGKKLDYEMLESDGAVPNMSGYAAWQSGGSWALANAGDEVVLLDRYSTIIDVAVIKGGAFPQVTAASVDPPDTKSLARLLVRSDTDNCATDFAGADPTPKSIVDSCGDGKQGAGFEVCDSGADNGKYGFCAPDCMKLGPRCGDGVVQDPQEQCDDGNTVATDGCTDACKTATCGDGIVRAGVEDCDDQNADDFDGCRQDCLAGLCTGTSCDDKDACTGAETCDPYTGCKDGADLVCDNNDACDGKETCAPASGCVAGVAPVCSDGNVCNGVETCDKAAGCVGGVPLACGNNDVCDGIETCDPVKGCVPGMPPVCNDGNQCTDDSCDAVTGCAVVNRSGVCDDGTVCTTGDACAAGECVGTPVLCDDNNECTDDTCDPVAGCQAAFNTAACDDASACTSNDVCADGTCSGVPIVCNDQDVCTDDDCDPATGCIVAFNTVSCDDKDACTGGDTCTEGACAGAPVSCDDDNVCTDDSCDPATGCSNVANAASCDDGNACTAQDLCSNSECKGTEDVTCDDSNACTDDACDTGKGCTFTANSLACDDGDPCTTDDTCGGSACKGQPMACNDLNACTADSCDAGACVSTPVDGPCSDGDKCTEDDACANGQCAGTAKKCDDYNVCTQDSCEPASGCVFTPGAGACDDGNVCTTDDACNAGTCFGTDVAGCCNTTFDCAMPKEKCLLPEHACVPVQCSACVQDSDCGEEGNVCLALGSGKRCVLYCSSNPGVCPAGSKCTKQPDLQLLCIPEGGDCQCVPDSKLVCKDGDLYHADSCGVPGDLAESCDGNGCADGACCPPGSVEVDGKCASQVESAELAEDVIEQDQVGPEEVLPQDAGEDTGSSTDQSVTPDQGGVDDTQTAPDSGVDVAGEAVADDSTGSDASDDTGSGGGSGGGGCSTGAGPLHGQLGLLLGLVLLLAVGARRGRRVGCRLG